MTESLNNSQVDRSQNASSAFSPITASTQKISTSDVATPSKNALQDLVSTCAHGVFTAHYSKSPAGRLYAHFYISTVDQSHAAIFKTTSAFEKWTKILDGMAREYTEAVKEREHINQEKEHIHQIMKNFQNEFSKQLKTLLNQD